MNRDIRPTLKPGQTLENTKNKFKHWSEGNGIGYYPIASRNMDDYQTDSHFFTTYAQNPNEFGRSFEITASLKKAQQQPPRSPEKSDSYKASLNYPKLFKSSTRASFENIMNIHNRVVHYRPEDFKPAFDARAAEGNAQESVELHQIPEIVVATMGPLASEFIVDKIAKMASDISVLRRVFWSEFSTRLVQVLSIIYQETTLHRERPYETYANIPLDKGLGKSMELTTNYRESFPNRQQQQVAGAPQNSLFAGTTKAVGHIPNFCGHIPASLLNPRKQEHATGRVHPTKNDLLLTKRAGGAIKNYTGHLPTFARGEENERRTGCDPRTTTGAAYGPERRIL